MHVQWKVKNRSHTSLNYWTEIIDVLLKVLSYWSNNTQKLIYNLTEETQCRLCNKRTKKRKKKNMVNKIGCNDNSKKKGEINVFRLQYAV
jgi:hypothetical protein